MATRFEEIQQIRIEKLNKLRELGINPYPSTLAKNSVKISSIQDTEGDNVIISGRITRWREHGNSTFADIKDETGTFQIFFQKKNLGDQYKITKLFDVGDFLLISGKTFKTQAGQLTIDVEFFQLLTKSIRPVPDDWYGLKDVEERHRRRYLDLLAHEDLKDIFRKKAVFWQSMRNFLIEKGFLEVETPALEATAGGADANPFITHHDALDVDLYLRISMGELWQKRLMVGGFEKTFEIGRQFRNEGLSREHLQDYSQMEFYWAYANYEDGMNLVEELYKHIIEKTFGKTKFTINGFEVDFGSKWEKIDYVDTIKNNTGIDITSATEEEIKTKLQELKAEYDRNDTKARLIDTLWKQVRKKIAGPVFLVGHPVEVSPLAKRMENNPNFVERYQLIIAGSEMGNGYSELNDPIDQAERFAEQQKMRDEGDVEAQMQDTDFVEALEYGMPPTTGFGVSERLFSFLVDMPIKEAVLFPLMRPESSVKSQEDKKEE